MEVLSLISAVAGALNAAPNSNLSEIVSVINSLASCIESLHQHQKALNAAAGIPAVAAPASPSNQ